MKKIFKIVSILILIFVGILGAAIVVVRKMFPPEKIKEMVIQTASEKLKREVKLGEIKIGIFSGIQIKNFALSESPAFKNGTFVQSERFVLKFQLLPLLKKNVVIDEVRLDAPQIRIVQNPDGKTFNFSDFMESSTDVPPAKPKVEETSKPPPVSLTISKVKISKGKVEFVDRSPKKIQVSLNPIELSLLGTGLDRPMSLDLSVGVASQLQGKKISGELKSKLVIDLKSMKVQFESLVWKMPECSLSLKGKVSNFLKPDMDISATAADINFQKLSQWVTLPKGANISGSPKLELAIKGQLDDLWASLLIDFTNTEIKYEDLFQKSNGTVFNLSLKGKAKKQKDMVLDSLELKLGAIEMSSKGEILNLTSQNPTVKIEAKTNAMDLKQISQFSKLAGPYSLAGQITLNASASGLLKLLQVNGSLNLEKVQAKYEKINLEDLTGLLKFTDSSAEWSKLTGKISSQGKTTSEFVIKTSVKNFKSPELFLDAQLSALDLGMFIDDKKEEKKKDAPKESKKETEQPYKGPLIKAQGKISIARVIHPRLEAQNAVTSWNLAGITPELSKLNGALVVEMGQGKIQKVPVLATIGPILRMDPSVLAFTRLGGNFTVTAGTAKTDDFQVNSSAADIYAKGVLHLPTNNPDMLLTVKLPKGSVGGSLGEFSADEEGRPSYSFKLKNSWKPTLDTSQVQKKVVEKATQEIKKKGTEILKEEGKKLIEGFFRR